MAARAIQLLKEVTTNLGPRLQSSCVQFHQTYISECLDRLRAHYDTVNALKAGTPNPPRFVTLLCRYLNLVFLRLLGPVRFGHLCSCIYIVIFLFQSKFRVCENV